MAPHVQALMSAITPEPVLLNLQPALPALLEPARSALPVQAVRCAFRLAIAVLTPNVKVIAALTAIVRPMLALVPVREVAIGEIIPVQPIKPALIVI